ncbi:MAG: Clp protease/crotonase-like domain-containing protein [Phycisphaerales bacterium]
MNILRARKTTIAILAVVGSVFAMGSSAIADEVIMRDGTVHSGKVVSRDRRTVIIDTEVHGISTRLRLDRRSVKSIVISDDAEEASPSAVDSGGPSTLSIPSAVEEEEDELKVLKRDGYNLVLEVPLEGTFGQDIYPLGVANSLAWAKEVGVTDVVFRINSGGGELWCANDMVAIMKDYHSDFKMHMLIESAISASIWPSFNCDTITMAPGSDFGGAVGYTTNATGSAEVDLKMNSIMSAKLESTADANGHSGYLVRAMILSKAAVYAYQDHNGEWILSDSTEGLPSNYETIDGPDTVLTLTQKQAVKYGIVDAMTEGNTLEEWAEVQGIDKWDNAGQFGYETVAEDVEDCKRIRDRMIASINGFYTERGQYGGAQYIRTAGSALNGMNRYLGQYKRLIREAEEMHMPSIVDSFEQAIDVTYYENWIRDTKKDLRNLFRP